jgi:hypothetical protein
MTMLLFKLTLSILSVLFIADYCLAFIGGNAGTFTGGLCRPCFSLFYPHLSMKSGAIVWLAEFAVILLGVLIWFI